MTIADLPVWWLPLADAIIKATLVLGAASIVVFALRRASAALRHLVWTLALSSALVLPALTVAMPRWQLPVFTVRVEQPAPAPVAQPDAPSLPSLAPLASAHAEAPDRPASSRDRRTDSASLSRTSWIQGLTWPQALFAVWLLGACVVVSRMVIGLTAVTWLTRRTVRVTDAPWLPTARRLAAELGVTPGLRFLRSGYASMPIAAGIFRPAVIVPAAADDWCENRLRIVLLHELAHVKRRDCLTHLVAQTACALHWFNPLAWMAARRVRAERERACDDLVLASGTRGPDYADQLLEIARVMQDDRFPGLLAGASVAMAHRSQLEGRLMAILDPRLPRSGVTRAGTAAAVALCCCTVAPLGAVQPWGTTTVKTDQVVTPIAPDLDRAIDRTPDAASPEPAQPVPQQSKSALPVSVRGELQPVVGEVAGAVAGSIAPVVAEGVALAQPALVAALADALDDAVQTPPIPSPSPTPTPTPGAGGPRPGTSSDSQRKADPRMVAALTAALKDSDKEVRETAMHALIQMRDPAIVEPLLQALKDSSPDVREQAAFGLGQLRDRRAVQPLTGALKDENADVREQAAFALGQLRDPSAAEALGGALRDANADVRERAAFALGQLRDRRAVPQLISGLKDDNPSVREQVAFALGQLRDASAVDPLIIAMKDANADVRGQVVFALGQLRDPRAIDALMAALKDESADVRQQAAFALGQLAR